MKKFGYTNFQVFINDKDVTEGVTICEVYLDITNPCWSARVSFLDSVDMINNLPITKGDKVKIIIETSNTFLKKESKEFNFILYKISDKIHYSQHSIGFSIYLAKPIIIKNINTRVSRNLKGEPTKLASDLFNEFFTPATCDTKGSNGQVNIMACAWTPLNTIGQLLKSSHKNNIADYLLIQREDEKFDICSISDMYDDELNIKFKYIPNAVGEAINYPYLINKYEVEHFDSALNLASGFYANNVVSYDYTNKKWGRTDYSNTQDKENLSDGQDYENDTSSFTTFQPMHHQITDEHSQLNDFNTWLPSRKAALFKLEQEKLLIQTNGNMEYVNMIGKSIMVEIPKQDYFNRQQLDFKRSGKHLVTAISFILNKQMFVTNIELVKREFESS